MRCLIVYSSSEGQTNRIAKRIAECMQQNGVPTDLFNVNVLSAETIAVDTYDAVVFGSPLHYGQYDARIAWCIGQYRDYLANIPTAFFSVSLGIVSSNDQDREAVVHLEQDFLERLQWKPCIVQCFAGALRNSRYGWITKRVMHTIARRSGSQTNMQHDFEYTDWQEVQKFAERFVKLVSRSAAGGGRLAAWRSKALLPEYACHLTDPHVKTGLMS